MARVLSNRYKLGNEIGRGGGGVVYEALDRELHVDVAVKLVPLTKVKCQRELTRLLAAGPKHVNIVRIIDYFIDQEEFVVVMERMHEDLYARLKRLKHFPQQAVRGIALQLFHGLQHLHCPQFEKQFVLHRDLHPGNIFCDPYGVCKIGDFGISKVMTEQAAEQSSLKGCLNFMAPEKFVPRMSLTVATDVYGVMAIVFFLLTGKMPYAHLKPGELAQLQTNFEGTAQKRGILQGIETRELHGAFVTLILQGLHSQPDERPTLQAILDRLTEMNLPDDSATERPDDAAAVANPPTHPVTEPFLPKTPPGEDLQKTPASIQDSGTFASGPFEVDPDQTGNATIASLDDIHAQTSPYPSDVERRL